MAQVPSFRYFCSAAEEFWKRNLAPAGERIILVEAMSQDLRVSIRTLTVANALRRMEPARLVVYSGTDEVWNDILWTFYDQEDIDQLAASYGAETCFDVHAVVDARIAGERGSLEVAGVDLLGELPEAGIVEERFEQLVDASVSRLAKIPFVDDTEPVQRIRETVRRRSVEFARVFDAVMARNDVVALVTSHVDYNNFGLAVEAAVRREVPVLFAQSTGGLKSYSIFPEHQVEGEPVRTTMTRQVGEFFERHVWPNRDLLRAQADLTLWRSKSAFNRPAWWRPDGVQVTIDSAEDRAAMRRVHARQLGLDPARPVVTVFAHAVSDALGANHEAFRDLATWFSRTVEFAADHDEVQWLLVDHPKQSVYDSTDFFGSVADRFADRPHLCFRPSVSLTKDALLSLTDLVLTVRGSVGNEYPVYGIPALQAGWSESSQCGFVQVADTPEEYFALLQEDLAALVEGQALISAEQVERARLYTWFYRSASDLSSELVQHWSHGRGERLWKLLRNRMEQQESDAEPAFVAVHRMWRRREPFLTSIDWDLGADQLRDALAPVEVK